MKKVLFAIVVLGSVSLLTSCSEQEDPLNEISNNIESPTSTGNGDDDNTDKPGNN